MTTDKCLKFADECLADAMKHSLDKDVEMKIATARSWIKECAALMLIELLQQRRTPEGMIDMD